MNRLVLFVARLRILEATKVKQYVKNVPEKYIKISKQCSFQRAFVSLHYH